MRTLAKKNWELVAPIYFAVVLDDGAFQTIFSIFLIPSKLFLHDQTCIFFNKFSLFNRQASHSFS